MTYGLQFLTSGVGVLSGPGGQVGFSTYDDYRLVKRYLLGKLDANGNVTTGEVDTFYDWELNKIMAFLAKVDEPAYQFRIFQKGYGSGLAVVAGIGTWMGIPSIAHLELLQTLKLVSTQRSMVGNDIHWGIVQGTYLESEKNDNTIMAKVLSFPEAEAKAMTEQVTAEQKALLIPAKTEGVPEHVLEKLAA